MNAFLGFLCVFLACGLAGKVLNLECGLIGDCNCAAVHYNVHFREDQIFPIFLTLSNGFNHSHSGKTLSAPPLPSPINRWPWREVKKSIKVPPLHLECFTPEAPKHLVAPLCVHNNVTLN